MTGMLLITPQSGGHPSLYQQGVDKLVYNHFMLECRTDVHMER